MASGRRDRWYSREVPIVKKESSSGGTVQPDDLRLPEIPFNGYLSDNQGS